MSKIIHTRYAMPHALWVNALTKRFGHTTAVNTVSLDMLEGERLALIGPSGCGKTTLLRLIAGLETPDGGEIHLHGQCVSSTGIFAAPHARQVAMVFQELALWPHMQVHQHLRFVLNSKRYKGAEKNKRIDEIIEYVQLQKRHLTKYPGELSGGEKQRLAIARALAQEPKLLLMDEPFSSLDDALTYHLVREIDTLLKQLEITLIYVTHRWQEAVFLTEKVAVMQQGKILRVIDASEYEGQITAQPRAQRLCTG